MALYDAAAGGYFGRFADAIEAGEPVVVRAWEIGAGLDGHVRVEPDGALRQVAWDESARRWIELAERGIGLAIRKGQEAGEIQTQADGGWSARARNLQGCEANKKSAGEFFSHGTERSHTYAMTDGGHPARVSVLGRDNTEYAGDRSGGAR